MRTEQDVLKDFEALGWKVERGFKDYYNYEALCLSIVIPNYFADGEQLDKEIVINLENRSYRCDNYFYGGAEFITMQEHKLLNELFHILGWI